MRSTSYATWRRLEVFTSSEPIKRSTAFDKAPAEYRTVLEDRGPSHPGAKAYYQLADAILDGVKQPA